MLTPEQSRAARGLLDWSQAELAKRSNLSESTIRDFEKGRRVPAPNNLQAIISAFESSGIEIIYEGYGSFGSGNGARLVDASEDAKRNAKIRRIEFQIAREISMRNDCDNIINFYKNKTEDNSSVTEHIINEISTQQRAINRIEERLSELSSEYEQLTGSTPDFIDIFNRREEAKRRREEREKSKRQI